MFPLNSGELEQSVLSEYEERLVLKREEVTQLQEQRDQLLATQRKLQELQQKMTDVSSRFFPKGRVGRPSLGALKADSHRHA